MSVLAIGLVGSAFGCQEQTESEVSSGGSSGSTGGAGGHGAASSTSAAGGTGGASCDGASATIEDVHAGSFASGERVKLTGVVAMSRKHLVSRGTSGSCLWGVFISSPGLNETQPGSGILVTDYGFDASIPPDGDAAHCPELGVDPTGDDIPDDVQPGDQLTLVGEPNSVLLPNGSVTPELTMSKVCGVVSTGQQPIPAAQVVDAASLVLPGPWDGVKIRVEGVHPVVDAAGQIVGPYGTFFLQEGNLQVGASLVCQGSAPVYSALAASPSPQLDVVEGIVLANGNGWQIAPLDKCNALSPASEDCAGLPSCP